MPIYIHAGFAFTIATSPCWWARKKQYRHTHFNPTATGSTCRSRDCSACGNSREAAWQARAMRDARRGRGKSPPPPHCKCRLSPQPVSASSSMRCLQEQDKWQLPVPWYCWYGEEGSTHCSICTRAPLSTPRICMPLRKSFTPSAISCHSSI